MTQLALIVTSRTQPGRRSDVHDLFRTLMAPHAQANVRQELVVWCDDQQDEDMFHLFEIYSDVEALQANATSDFFADYMTAAGPLLAAEPSVRMATPTWSTGHQVR